MTFWLRALRMRDHNYQHALREIKFSSSTVRLNSFQHNSEVWSRNVVECEKHTPVKFANFVRIFLHYARKIDTDIEKKASILPKIYTKFANVAGLYFSRFTTFYNQTLQFSISCLNESFCCFHTYSRERPVLFVSMFPKVSISNEGTKTALPYGDEVVTLRQKPYLSQRDHPSIPSL